MNNTQSKENVLLNPLYIGARWGLRIILFILYYSLLYIFGLYTFQIKFSAYGILWISLICMLILSLLMVRLTKNLFKIKYLQYGYFALMFLTLAFYGSGQYIKTENSYSAYIKTEKFQKKIKDIQELVDWEDLPYYDYDGAMQYYYNNFPEIKWYSQELWSYQYFRGGCGKSDN